MAPWPAGLGEAMLALTVQAGACFPSPSDVENEGTAVNGTSFFFLNQILEKLFFFKDKQQQQNLLCLALES